VSAEVILIVACVALVLMPPRYDPAIRIKERQIKRGEHPESPDA
jgi:hypothetical protein